MKVLGNKDWTWEDVKCENLTSNRNCKIASKMAGQPVKTDPYSCSMCLERPDAKEQTCPAITRLALLKKKEIAEKKIVHAEERLGEGVGTELFKLIPKIVEKSTCSCKSYAKKMNVWGPATCEKNREHIVQHLFNQAKGRGGLFGWVPEAATKMVANKLLSTAISRAIAKETPEHVDHKWFCAVTTAPRQIQTLQTCLDSMSIAGFRPMIFAEPGNYDLTPEYSESIIMHKKRLGVWHNWLFSLRYALENSDANIIMTVQDDSLFHPDSKQFTRNILWPHDRVGFVSLYTPAHYNKKPHMKTAKRPCGINRIWTRSMWGACALVWPRKVVEEMLEQPLIKTWIGAPTKTKNSKVMQRRKANPHMVQNSDTAIGKLMNRMDRSMWFMDPSPVNHFATTSAASHGGNGGNRNCGRCAEWGKSLEEQIPLLTNGKELPEKVAYKDIII